MLATRLRLVSPPLRTSLRPLVLVSVHSCWLRPPILVSALMYCSPPPYTGLCPLMLVFLLSIWPHLSCGSPSPRTGLRPSATPAGNSTGLTQLPSPQILHCHLFMHFLSLFLGICTSKLQTTAVQWLTFTEKGRRKHEGFFLFKVEKVEWATEIVACGIHERVRQETRPWILRRHSKSKQTRIYFKLSRKNVEISSSCVTQVQKKRGTGRKLKKITKY